MDKNFWSLIARNDYQIPEGHTHAELTQAILGYLSSSDPVLRDEIAYMVFAHWLKREMYTREEISQHVEALLTNLEMGIGETGTDSVFLRAFSALFLAEIVHNDNRKPLLDSGQIDAILTRGLRYLSAEQDPRGYIPVKGWAHALAHTADLMMVLASNRNLTANDLQNILFGISSKMTAAAGYFYIHGEDERLARAVMAVLRRRLLSEEEVRVWVKSFTAPEDDVWKGAYEDEERNRAFQNTRNLLRSISLELIMNEEHNPDLRALSHIFLKGLQDLSPN